MSLNTSCGEWIKQVIGYYFVFKQPVMSMQRELFGCLLLKFQQTGRSVVSTPQLCALAEWYSALSQHYGIMSFQMKASAVRMESPKSCDDVHIPPFQANTSPFLTG